MAEQKQRTVFTVGYGNRTPDEFVQLLHEHGIREVVDVRLRPDRARLAAFKLSKDDGKGIRALLKPRGIGYLSFVELGNVFLDCIDWEPRYRRLLESATPLLLERVLGTDGDFALLCAEIDHKECHRTIIAEHLAYYGRRIVHL
jgi:uncharacterized protein (DUF488 family)